MEERFAENPCFAKAESERPHGGTDTCRTSHGGPPASDRLSSNLGRNLAVALGVRLMWLEYNARGPFLFVVVRTLASGEGGY